MCIKIRQGSLNRGFAAGFLQKYEGIQVGKNMSKYRTLKEVENGYPKWSVRNMADSCREAICRMGKMVVVLDDDPTGIQTVHDVPVYTDWSPETIMQAFIENEAMFFVLTNSRSFSRERTIAVHTEITENILEAAKKTGKSPLIISRCDSTLRGHYPAETETIAKTIRKRTEENVDGEVIIPFFPEGGRYTAEGIHYVLNHGELIPAAETEFAKDMTFGYGHSHLAEWIEEKTEGKYRAENVCAITLSELRSADVEGIEEKLMEVNDFGKVIVDALDYKDLDVFILALVRVLARGKNFIFRTAAAFVKAIGGIEDVPLLTRKQIIGNSDTKAGLLVAGSHVERTTLQLSRLIERGEVQVIIFDQHKVLYPAELKREVKRVQGECEESLRKGSCTLVMTRREKLVLCNGDKEAELKIANEISDAVTKIVSGLQVRPSFILAKGGITSSDIGVKGLGVKKAVVQGQIKPGIPVWKTGKESKFPGISYIIFPGNVGTEEDLKDIVDMLK